MRDLEIIAPFIDGLARLQLLLIFRVEEWSPEISGAEDGGSALESTFQGLDVVEVSLDNLDALFRPILGLVGISGHTADLPAWFVKVNIRD